MTALKTKSWLPALAGMTLLLTGCARDLSAPRASLPAPAGILRLKAGQAYKAQSNEVWHSAERYQRLELELMDAVSAVKQLRAQ